MLTFYYHPLSPVARRVWIALLEKEIPFTGQVVNLMGEQFQPEFLALNPFHHVPVIVDEGVTVVESLAILDYLEAAYPQPSLVPSAPAALARMRMVQMVTVNELMTKLPALMALSQDGQQSPDPALDQVRTALTFLEQQLADRPFFGGDILSLGDVVAGATIPLLVRIGLALQDYPALGQWHDRITARPAWQATHSSDADFALWVRWVQVKLKRHQQSLRKQLVESR